MFCPIEYWNLGDPDGPNIGRHRLRRALVELLSSLSVLSWLGHMIVIPPDPSLLEEDADAGPASGPPSGHPERVPDDGPLSDAEREFWIHLEGLDWR